MRNNLMILTLLLIGMAVAGRMLMKTDREVAALQRDLQNSLGTLWKGAPCQVQVSRAGPQEVDVTVTQTYPDTARQNQKVWDYQLIRFVALAHPNVQLQTVKVLEPNKGAVSEAPPSSGDLQDMAYFEAARSEMVRRGVQSSLDQSPGPGQALILVDVIGQAPSRGRSRHGRRYLADRAAPRAKARYENNVGAPPDYSPGLEVGHMQLVLVTRIDSNGALDETCKRQSGFDPSRGDSFVVIQLPASDR